MFTKIASLFSQKAGAQFKTLVQLINEQEAEISALPEGGLRDYSKQLREKIQAGDAEGLPERLVTYLPQAFALVRETAKRTLEQRHFDVQLMGGIALHQGSIVEMRTGEGKTLSATSPAYLNALVGKGVHVITVNEYLAKRDAVWMGQVYYALGLSVACLIHEGALMYDPEYKVEKQQDNTDDQKSERDEARDTLGSFKVEESYLRPITRKEAYEADITYGSNHEFGFDYLRDNLAPSKSAQVQRKPYYAVIDEIDSVLIDEARTPLIISAPDQESSKFYKTFSRLVASLHKETDYLVDEKLKSVDISESGIDAIEKSLDITNLYAPENLRLSHYLQESLKAKELFLRDKDYVVKNGEIIIVDQFTGRLMAGRRYSGGLHQAIEAKEGVFVNQESRTYASISIQNYFRLYEKLSGMTGTAQTSAEEFDKVYGLEVVTIPTHRPMVRDDMPDLVYKNAEGKTSAIIEDIKKRHEKGQPVLIGTVSIEKNEELSARLSRAGLKHEVLNAKNNEDEGSAIAQAGKPGAITVATNMAGRGVDIILGGNPAREADAANVREVGGLHVVGTERHESRRIDNQLRGRAGRQGDKGSSQFFLSLDDDLMRVFGGDRIKNLMETLKVPEDLPIESKLVSRAISQSQTKVEGMHFDARKHLLDYDDVLNKQRLSIYKRRQEMLESGAHPQVLGALDSLWMNHLENMDALRDSVRLRAYGQHEPLVEYRRDGHIAFRQLLEEFEKWKQDFDAHAKSMEGDNASATHEAFHAEHKENSQFSTNAMPAQKPKHVEHIGKKIGRNEPCFCGSGKKYKKCHGA